MGKKQIRPYRNIPFDLGAALNTGDITAIRDAAKENGLNELPIPSLLSRFSKYISLRFTVNDDIRLYIYSFGIGVFTMRDDTYDIVSEKYAVEYCESRKKYHHMILNGEHKYSETLFSVIEWMRNCVKANHKSIRSTASLNWESNGLSYVMTVSSVQLPDLENFNYSELNDTEKKNLLIMLEPGIAHQEDTLLFDSDIKPEKVDPYGIDVSHQEPTNWMKSNDAGLYISWAAVIMYSRAVDDNSAKYLEYMEVNLQAMWMYVYCMYHVMSHKKQKDMKVSTLKRELFTFKKMYNEFTSPDDSNIAEYFKNIRNELIRTSGIESEKDKYLEYLEFCIEDTVSLNEEKTRKYSIFSEILLFVIAYAQIAPLLYHLLMGEYTNLGTWQIIVVALVAVIGTILIIRKE